MLYLDMYMYATVAMHMFITKELSGFITSTLTVQ